jgi:hypothetical protein
VTRPTDLKARVLTEARAILADDLDGFTHDRMADLIGGEYRNGGADERKLRTALLALQRADSLARGLWIAGPRLQRDLAAGPGVDLARRVYDAFCAAGGVLHLHQLHQHLGVAGDPTAVRMVADVLAADGRYESGVPIAGWRKAWRLADDLRQRLPVPGRLQALQARLDMDALGRRPIAADIALALQIRRQRIGLAVQEARDLAGLAVAEIIADRAVETALAADLSASEVVFLADDGGRKTLGGWWGDMVAAHGLRHALTAAWRSLESPILLGANPADALSVASWRSIAAVIGADGAALSRGWVRLP